MGACLTGWPSSRTRAVAPDVEHQPAADAGLLHDREAGQLLQRLEGLAVRPYERVEALAHDRDDGPAALHVHVDVAVHVGDVEQPLEVVAGDVALLHQQVGRRVGCGAVLAHVLSFGTTVEQV
jgi:hypothetical protein